MQTRGRIFDDIAKLANGAFSAAAGVRAEIDQLIQQQLERLLASRDLVTREEFDAVEAMAAKARLEQEALVARVAELEAKLASTAPTPKAAAKTAAKAKTLTRATRRASPRSKSASKAKDT